MSTMDDPSVSGVSEDPEATRQYLEQIRSLHREWDELESRGDDSVQLSQRVRSTLSEAVRADARHGARVQMPPTDLGPYTLSELALRSLIRETVDSVPGAVSLRTSVDYAPGQEWSSRGLPRKVTCRVSFDARTRDLRRLAETTRGAVIAVCDRELGLTGAIVDIHIEDLHEH